MSSKFYGFSRKTPMNTPKIKPKYHSDDEIIIPNSHIPIPKGGLNSFKMDLDEFKDRLIGKIRNRQQKPTRIEFLLSDGIGVYQPIQFMKYVQLENGFCYAQILIQTSIPYVGIIYIEPSTSVKCFYPLRGNNINRITENPVTGNEDDKFWLWEEINWGQQRPHGPVQIEDSEFDRLTLCFQMIEEETRNRAKIVPKTKKQHDSMTQ